MSYQFTQKKRADDHHGVDDWLMTYADMITLLLCFFAVFLSVSAPKKDIFDQAREKVLERFSGHKIDRMTMEEMQMRADRDSPYDSLPSIVDRFHMSDSPYAEGRNPYEEKKDPEGDRIHMIEIPSMAVFSSGSATLSDEGKAILFEIAEKSLKAPDRQDYQITIEGHTDDVPINTIQFPSNWELSTARAATVVRYLIEQGIEPQRLRAAGYADTFPKVPNRDASGQPLPENQSQNRRVLIKLEKIEKR